MRNTTHPRDLTTDGVQRVRHVGNPTIGNSMQRRGNTSTVLLAALPLSKSSLRRCSQRDVSTCRVATRASQVASNTNAASGCRKLSPSLLVGLCLISALLLSSTEVLDKYLYANLIQTDVANKLSSIEVCCTGYSATRLKGVTVCRPICSCVNGSCRVPGECDCYEGFVKNDNGDCVFACPLGCQNGRCFLDGSCQCDVGYTLDETRRFCRPICSSNCDGNPRHNCTEPEICSCRKGYQLTNDGCQPVCDPDCGIGGICRENNECDCGPGYSLRDYICQTDCYQ